jgi:hypothetical protein
MDNLTFDKIDLSLDNIYKAGELADNILQKNNNFLNSLNQLDMDNYDIPGLSHIVRRLRKLINHILNTRIRALIMDINDSDQVKKFDFSFNNYDWPEDPFPKIDFQTSLRAIENCRLLKGDFSKEVHPALEQLIKSINTLWERDLVGYYNDYKVSVVKIIEITTEGKFKDTQLKYDLLESITYLFNHCFFLLSNINYFWENNLKYA